MRPAHRSLGRTTLVCRCHSLVNPSGICGSSPPLRPQIDRVAPRVLERAVEAVELGPVVMAPQDGGAVLLGAVEDASSESSSLTRIQMRTAAATAAEVPGSTPAGPGAAGRWRRCRSRRAGCRRWMATRRRAGRAAGHAAVEDAGRGDPRPPIRRPRRRSAAQAPRHLTGSRRRSECSVARRSPLAKMD